MVGTRLPGAGILVLKASGPENPGPDAISVNDPVEYSIHTAILLTRAVSKGKTFALTTILSIAWTSGLG